jgi:hypothetical protein
MAAWAKIARLSLAGIFGLAVIAEGIYTAQSRSPGEPGFVPGIIFGLVLSVFGLLIYYSQHRYEKKQLGQSEPKQMQSIKIPSDGWGSSALMLLGTILVGLAKLIFVISAVYFIIALFALNSGKEASGIPLAMGIFGGGFFYLLGDTFKKSA